MSLHVVKFDDQAQRAVKVLEDPVEAHIAVFEWLFRKLPFPVLVIEGPIDIEAQTIKGVPIRDIYCQDAVPGAA